MAIDTFIVLTAAQRDAATALNRPDYAVNPRVIDNTAANSLGFGTLVGLYVLPVAVLIDPNYSAWSALLGALPSHVMDSAALFIPATI